MKTAVTHQKVKIYYRDTGGWFIAESEADCIGEHQIFVYRTALKHGKVISCGMLYAEPMKESQ